MSNDLHYNLTIFLLMSLRDTSFNIVKRYWCIFFYILVGYQRWFEGPDLVFFEIPFNLLSSLIKPSLILHFLVAKFSFIITLVTKSKWHFSVKHPIQPSDNDLVITIGWNTNLWLSLCPAYISLNILRKLFPNRISTYVSMAHIYNEHICMCMKIISNLHVKCKWTLSSIEPLGRFPWNLKTNIEVFLKNFKSYTAVFSLG